MKKLLLAILFIVLVSFEAISQDSTYLALSPEWYNSYSLGLGGVARRISIDKDKNGNIYLASHSIKDGYPFSGQLLKHDPQGKLVWQNSIVQSEKLNRERTISDATNLIIDSKGNAILIGLIRVNSRFTSTDTTSEVVMKCEGVETNIIAKYDPNGKLQWAKPFKIRKSHDDPEYGITSVSIDKSDNIYFCGVQNIKVMSGSSASNDAAIWVGKFSTEGVMLWEKTFNGKGKERGISSVVDSKGYLYVASFFDDTLPIGADTLKTTKEIFNSFVFKFDKKGNIVWTLQASPNSKVQLKELTIDKDGNLYMAGEYRDTLRFVNNPNLSISSKVQNLFVASFNTKGKIAWVKSITEHWNATSYDGLERMKIGDDGFLYLAGGAYNMGVPTINSKRQEFLLATGKYSKNVEGFIIKCDTKGNAHWLRFVSGSSKQDISDFIVNANSDVIISGKHNGDFEFKNNPVKTAGNVFLAKVSASALLDTGPDKVFYAIQQEEIRKKAIDMEACTCELYTEKPTREDNPVGLRLLAEFTKFQKETLFEGISEEFYNRLFVKGLRADASHDGTFYQFEFRAYKPIRFKPAKDAITIDLTPCVLKSEPYTSIPSHFFWSHPLKYRHGFSEEEFKGTGKEFYDIAINLSSIQPRDILVQFIGESEGEEIQPFADYLKAKFKIPIKVVGSEFSIEEQVLNSGKEIDLLEEIYNFYLKPLEGPGQVPTKNFESLFQNMFYSNGQTYSVSQIKDMTQPDINGTLDVKRFKVEFSPTLIHSESPWAMFKVDEGIRWTNKEGITLSDSRIEQFCMKPFSIGNTSVRLSINNAFVDLSPLVNSYEHGEMQPPFPKYSDLYGFPKEFVGIYAPKFNAQIPMNDQVIEAKGYDLSISNLGIKGYLEVKPIESITGDALVNHLLSQQFRNVKLINNNGIWVVSFTYTLSK